MADFIASASTEGSPYELSYNTVKEYGYNLGMLKRFLNEKPIVEITSDDITKFLANLVRRGYKTNSIKNVKSCLWTFFIFLQDNGYINENPMDNIKEKRKGRGKRVKKRFPVFLTNEEAEKLLTAPNFTRKKKVGVRDKLVLRLLYVTGIRLGELLRIKVKDIDLKNGTIQIRGKGDKTRTVLILDKLIGDGTVDMLDAWINGKKQEDLLFEGLSPRAVQMAVKIYAQKAGIKKQVTPHKLRHSFATRLISEGVRTESVQKLLGHESITTTQIYAQVTQKATIDELKKLNLM
ncbi:MAG: site-specific tyrosine recombinase/integron integrase [Candidatus Hydrothermarchaeaceae archaeon]